MSLSRQVSLVGLCFKYNMPFLSIIIPAKNEEQDLPRLLDSIRMQTFRDYEVIVADAYSVDATRDIARSYGARVIDGGMPGPGRNRGAEQATGEMLLFLDADAKLPSASFLEDTLNEMARRDLDIATCRVKPLTERTIDRAFHGVFNMYAQVTQRFHPHVTGACIFSRSAVHHSIGGFDERVVFAEDHDYVQRMVRRGASFGILRTHPIIISTRRFERDGYVSLALKFLFTEAYMIAKGPLKKMPFTYDMGNPSSHRPPTHDT